MLRFFWALLVSLVCSLAGGRALAQEASEEARAQFEEAVSAYDRGAYEVAEAGFRRSYELSGHPDLLYNVYLAAERAGHYEAAAEALEGFLAEGEIPADRRAAFEQRLVRLRARIEAAEVSGEPVEVLIEQEDGEELATPVIFVKRSRIHPAATGLFVAASALAVSFAVAAALSEIEDRDLASSCGRDTAFPNCADEELDALKRRNLVADISWIGALAAAGAGLVVLFTVDSEGGDERTTVSADLGPGRAGLRLRGTF